MAEQNQQPKNQKPVRSESEEYAVRSQKLEGLDCVSIGPNIRDIHTTRERLEIASTERVWKFLLEVLKNL